MSFQISDFGSLNRFEKWSVAEQVALATSGGLDGESLEILPVDGRDILAKQLGFVASVQGEMVGYIGADGPLVHDGTYMAKVGSLWVAKSARRLGIATSLVADISTRLVLEGQTPYAVCNPQSKGAFERSGYLQVPDYEVPPRYIDGEYTPLQPEDLRKTYMLGKPALQLVSAGISLQNSRTDMSAA